MNEKEIKSVVKEVNKLLKRLEKKGKRPSKQELSLLEDITEQIELKRGKIKEEREQSLVDKLESLVQLSAENKDVSETTTKSIVDAIEKIKLIVPAPTVTVEPPKVEVNVPEVKVPAVKVPDVVVNMPEEMKISKPGWIDGIVNLLPITSLLMAIREAMPSFVWPSGAREPVSVRLSDGEKFYRALGGSGGAASIPTFKNSDGEVKQGLVDSSGHIQTDVLSSALPSGAATEAKQDDILTKLGNLSEDNIHTGSDELRVFQENHICTQNTTSTPLGSNATFTGVWQDCLNYQEVNISVVSDKNSATNGLVIQWSDNAVDIDDTDTFNIYANSGNNLTPNPSFRYVRVVYTNGATPQTIFRLMTILRRSMTGGSFHRVDSTLRDDNDGRLTINIPKLKTAANTYISQAATNSGNAKVSIEELESGVSVNSNSQLKVTPFNSSGVEGTTFNSSYLSAFGTFETAELTPAFQGDFIYGLNTQIWDYTYTFTVTDPTVDPTFGAIYTVNNGTFTVIYNTGTTLVCSGTSAPSASGTLTKASGTGDATIAYSAYSTSAGVASGTGAAIDTNIRRLRIQSGTSGTGFAYIEPRRNIRYRAGQGTTARFTPLFTAGVADNIQLWGMGTIANNAPYDGYFFGYNGTSFGIAHYIAGTPTWYSRSADWNVNKCDGSAGSIFNWNPVYGSPVMIKYPYLGFGDINFYVQRPTTGEWVLVHTIRYANTSITTQLANPSLHFLGYTKNTNNTTNMIMYCASVGIFISGTRSYVGNPKWSIDNNKSGVTTETNLVSLKCASSYNGVVNEGQVRLRSLSISSSAASGVSCFRIKLGTTLGGTPSYTAISGTTSDGGITITGGNSIVSYDTAGTTVTGGTYLFSIYADNPNTQTIDLEPYDIFVSPNEILTISGFSSSTSQLGVSINWSEDV